MLLSSLSLSRKLGLLVVSAVLALAVLAIDGIVSLKFGNEMMEEVANVRMPSIVGLETLSAGHSSIRSENRLVGFLLAQGVKPEEIGAVLKKKEKIWQRIDRGWKLYEPLPQTPEEAILWKRFEQEWAEWKKFDAAVDAEIMKIAQAPNEEARAKARSAFVAAAYATVPLFNKAEGTLGEIVELNIRVGNDSARAAEKQGSRSMRLMIAVSVLATIGMAVMGSAIGRSIFNTIGGEPAVAKTVVERIATGDLTQKLELKAGDSTSLLASQHNMQDKLIRVIGEISRSVCATQTSAEELSAAAQQVAGASADTSDSASSMAASVEQLSVSISQVSENAQAALRFAERTGELSTNGSVVIENAISEINHIAETVRTTARDMETLKANSDQISSVVQVIKDVADQTNLLALNAAIEAARAGESGRGFAVVADEVRKLAERTTSATVEIGTMIDRVRASTESSLTAMEAAVEQVDKGVALASQAGTAIVDIRDSVTEVVGTVGDIVGSIDEQSAASQQIAQRVERVAQASEENNAAAQQTAHAAETLKTLAGALKSSISHFRT